MASLTGNKIKDTYSSLLKVGDNGVIDSSAQALTDGAGNALGLTLTNAGVIVSTTNGTLIENNLEVGQKVLVPKFGAQIARIENQSYIIASESDVLGIIK